MTSGIPTVKALPGFWWKSVFISGKQGNEGEQGNKDNIRENGTYENNKFSIFFWGGGAGEQARNMYHPLLGGPHCYSQVQACVTNIYYCNYDNELQILTHLWRDGISYERGTCIKGLFWPPIEPKTESCFSPISSY